MHIAIILHRFPCLTDVVCLIFLSRVFPLISPFRLRAFFILFAFSLLFVPNHLTTPHHTSTARPPHHTSTARPPQVLLVRPLLHATTPPCRRRAGAPHQPRTATAQHRRFSLRDRSSTQPLLRAGAPSRNHSSPPRRPSSRCRSSFNAAAPRPSRIAPPFTEPLFAIRTTTPLLGSSSAVSRAPNRALNRALSRCRRSIAPPRR